MSDPAASAPALRAVIVDDEPLARDAISMALAEPRPGAPPVTVVASCARASEALDAIRRERPDLLFLDIAMPGMDGFAVLEHLEPEETPPAVILVTAYDEHALRAFEARALDYLLKPLSPERFAGAVDRAAHRVREARALRERLDREPQSPGSAPADFLRQILVRERGRVLVVPVEDVEWIEADTYYVRLHTSSRSRLLRERMSVLESRLDPRQFFRSHRSAIVRLSLIREVRTVSRYEHVIELTTGARVPLSRERRARLEALLAR